MQVTYFVELICTIKCSSRVSISVCIECLQEILFYSGGGYGFLFTRGDEWRGNALHYFASILYIIC